jgi:hypothetical protein
MGRDILLVRIGCAYTGKAAEGRRTPRRFARMGPLAVAPASWSAPAERSGDGAFVRTETERTNEIIGRKKRRWPIEQILSH